MAALANTTRPRQRSAFHGAGARLPWWAVALPAVAFTLLLMLIVSGGDAGAAKDGESVAQLLRTAAQILPG
ncbi:hypothetical protein DVA86_17845 [Streptomyces armeniacus]|uniref:Uncharacterized protein n=1 Tax=Streptomyces armeniacus TaxID=83291 RepID=A0A345XRG8_9ACTN|nr:hypothetical protein [Streptomyces armeniacus]AXK34234.1 hypothetical protein DVA86_17845 [Streptomyces armeniacus]